jgi:hypothetical protein
LTVPTWLTIIVIVDPGAILFGGLFGLISAGEAVPGEPRWPLAEAC